MPNWRGLAVDAAERIAREEAAAATVGADVGRRVAAHRISENAAARATERAPKPKRRAAPREERAARPPDPPHSLRVEAPAIIRARSGQPLAVAQDVLQEAANPSRGRTGYGEWRAANPEQGLVFDLRDLARVPDVPQHQIPRFNPPRGPAPRMQRALANPDVERGLTETVKRGIEGGGLEWYNTEPLLERMGRVMPTNDAPGEYAALMDLVAATSPRSRIQDNIRTASYYNYLRRQGEPIPDEPAGGYGSVAQILHRDNARGLAERGGWDIFKNPKPASFSSNLQGNQMVATIDTHNMRLPGILSRDPEFLATSISELADSPEAALETLSRQYPGLPDEVVRSSVNTRLGEGFDRRGDPRPDKHSITYRPREWVNEGYIPMEDALNDPALWAAKPRDNEYGFYENWQQDQAAKLGITPAQYQASMWLGGGEDTGLGSAAEPFMGTFDARIRYTADQLGMDPEKVADMVVAGEIPMLAKGGPVRSLAVRP